MSLRFSLMGPVRAWRDDEEIELGPRQQRAVLAALLLNNGIRLSNDQLVGMVWDDPTPSAVMALRTYMYKIRKTLPELDVQSKDGGYRVKAEVIDDCRGEPLEGLQGRYFDAQRTRLAQHRLKAREDWLERELDTLELQKHVNAHPLREHPRALLMHALFRDGRQAEALDQFHQARTLLNEELGIDPGPELRTLHTQILKGEVRHRPKPAQLPPDVPDFTGRTAEIDRLQQALPGIAGITGMHGAGKTALAVHVGHQTKYRFPDGQIFVRGNDIANQLLRAIGIENPAGDKAALWREKARHKQFLIIVDDVQDSEEIRELVTPGSALIITSVRRLNDLPGVTWVKVGGFAPSEALEFFRKLLDPSRIDDDFNELVDRVSGLPVPLRVLGGRLTARPGWTIEMVLRQMDRDSRLGADLPVQCRELLAPLIKAEQEMSPDEREVLVRLSHTGTDEHDLCLEAELVLETLSEMHLVEPLVLGRYRLPEFVRFYFGLRTPALSC